MKPVSASSTGTGGDTVPKAFARPTSSGAPTSGPTSMRRSSPPRERASAFISARDGQGMPAGFPRRAIRSLYPHNHLLVVLDGAPSHRSEEIVWPENVSFLGLPAYSPELDPVERGGFKNSGASCPIRPSRRSS